MKFADALLGALSLAWAVAAHAEGDANRGKAVFATQCAECHSVREGKDRKGPSLFAVLGRKSGASPGFAYSAALKQSGIVWTADRLDAYITQPKKAIPGGNMKFDGLDQAEQRADLLAYLASLGAR